MGRAKLQQDLVFRLRADIAQLKKGLKQGRRQISTFQKAVKGLGSTLTGVFAGAAIIGGITTAIKKIAQLESRIKRVSIIAKGSEKEFGNLAKTLGSTTVFTAIEAADAMQFLAQAGFDTNQILKATPGVLDLAAAAQLDLAMAADITSNILSGYGLAASEVNRVNDILVTTTNSANLTVEQMGEAFKLVAPIAKSAGLSINEAAGFIGVLGDAGIQGTMAGTQLKGVIAALINPTAKGARVLERLGVAVSKNANGGLDLTKTLQDLKNAGLDTKDAFQLFNKISATGALVMAAATEKALELADATKEIGVANKQASAQLDTLSGDWALLTSAWDGTIQKGSSLISIMRGLTQAGTKLIEITNIISEVPGAIFNLYEAGFNKITGRVKASTVAIQDWQDTLFGTAEVTDPFLRRMLGLDDKAGTGAIVAPSGGGGVTAMAAEATDSLTGLSTLITLEAPKMREHLQGLTKDVFTFTEQTSLVGDIAGNAFAGMSNVITNALNSTENIFQAFGKFFGDFIKGMIIKLVAATVAALALTVVLSALGLAGGAGVLNSLGKVSTFGSSFKANLGSIGGFADGGVSSGGLAMVGERGREIVAMPQGSRVLSHQQTMNAVGGGGQTVKVIVEGKIKGEDIWLANTEAGRKLNNTRG